MPSSLDPATKQQSPPVARTFVCPWWLLPTFDNPLRRLIQNPYRILNRWVHPGDTAIDLGCGMGYFSIPLAQLVGSQGKVVCIDVQQQMLDGLHRRAEQAGVVDTITMRRCEPTRLGIPEPADFVLAFWMLHEVPDQHAFLAEVQAYLKPTGRFLLVEPVGHVGGKAFQRSLMIAEQAGLAIVDKPAVVASRSALFAAKSPTSSS